MADTTYGTVAQVKTVLNNDPAFSDPRVQELLNEVAAELDAVLLSAGYLTPVTGTQDLLLVSGFVVSFVAARAYREWYRSNDAPDHVTAWEARWEKFIGRLLDGTLRLPNQRTSNGGGLTTGAIILWPTSRNRGGY